MNYSVASSLVNSLNQVRHIYTEPNRSASPTEAQSRSIESYEKNKRPSEERELFQWLDKYLTPNEQGTGKTAQEIQTALNQQLRSTKLDLSQTFKNACVTQDKIQLDHLLTFLGKLVLLTKQPEELIQTVQNHSSEYPQAEPSKRKEIQHTTGIIENKDQEFIVQLMKETGTPEQIASIQEASISFAEALTGRLLSLLATRKKNYP